MGGSVGTLKSSNWERYQTESDDIDVLKQFCQEITQEIQGDEVAFRFCAPVLNQSDPEDDSDLESWKKRKADMVNCFKRFSQLCDPTIPESAVDLINRSTETLNLSFADEDDYGVAGNLFVFEILSLQGVPSEVWNMGDTLLHLSLKKNAIEYLPGDHLKQLHQLKTLDISENRLSELPNEISDLQKLEILNISENEIKELPATIGSLLSLKALIAFKNKLTSVPDSIGQCTSLEEVNLFNNKLFKVPNSLAQICTFVDLNIGGNKLKTLPETTNWKNVERLALSWNTIVMLRNFTGLESLVQLQLNRNQLGEIQDDAFDNCDHLESVDISSNRLETLPKSLSGCRKLKSLNVSNNQLEALLDMNQLQDIEILNLGNNKLTSIDGYGVEKCSTLVTLFVNLNQLSSLPANLDQDLVNLKRCNISENRDLDESSSVVEGLRKLCESNQGRWIN